MFLFYLKLQNFLEVYIFFKFQIQVGLILILIFKVVMNDDYMETTLSEQCCMIATIEKDNDATFDVDKILPIGLSN